MKLISQKLLFILSLATSGFCTPVFASANVENYQKARLQNILEFTVFGIDECLKSNQKILVVDETELVSEEMILVGSKKYFELMATCFNKMADQCMGENCIVNKSMKKRIENVKYIDKMISKYPLTSEGKNN